MGRAASLFKGPRYRKQPDTHKVLFVTSFVRAFLGYAAHRWTGPGWLTIPNPGWPLQKGQLRGTPAARPPGFPLGAVAKSLPRKWDCHPSEGEWLFLPPHRLITTGSGALCTGAYQAYEPSDCDASHGILSTDLFAFPGGQPCTSNHQPSCR